MLLNRFEKLMMNNPVRAGIQRRVEVPLLLRMGGPMRGGKALEIGCGRGEGVQLILDRFGAHHVDAFDLDADMVHRARTRLGARGDAVRLWVGDATAIDAEDETYDAVFDFGIVHHIPDWRRSLREVHRVLKPGGTFYGEEILRAFIHAPLWRRVLDHPLEDRFDSEGLLRGLEEVGLSVRRSRRLLEQVIWFVADRPS